MYWSIITSYKLHCKLHRVSSHIPPISEFTPKFRAFQDTYPDSPYEISLPGVALFWWVSTWILPTSWYSPEFGCSRWSYTRISLVSWVMTYILYIPVYRSNIPRSRYFSTQNRLNRKFSLTFTLGEDSRRTGREFTYPYSVHC